MADVVDLKAYRDFRKIEYISTSLGRNAETQRNLGSIVFGKLKLSNPGLSNIYPFSRMLVPVTRTESSTQTPIPQDIVEELIMGDQWPEPPTNNRPPTTFRIS